MKFSDFVKTESIQAELAADDKEGVIRELVTSLVDNGQLNGDEYENIVQAILEREKLGSTGIGRGIAVPHTKHPGVQVIVGTVGVSSNGVAFESLDGEKVQLFFMLISPLDRRNDHLKALENISKALLILQNIVNRNQLDQELPDLLLCKYSFQTFLSDPVG